jgi:hypothetical protein
LVELLVVIAIIGVLIALLLPAVQAAREAARRMQCTNHLKQWALGSHNHHALKNSLPPHGIHKDGLSGRQGRGISWVVWLMPFVEQQSLRDMIDNGGTAASVDGTTDYAPGPAIPWDINYIPWITTFPILLCPSDSNKNAKPETYFPSAASYHACNGDNAMDWHRAIPSDVGNWARGVFTRDINGYGRNLNAINDGTSNTLAFSEGCIGSGMINNDRNVRSGVTWISPTGAGSPDWCMSAIDTSDRRLLKNTGGWNPQSLKGRRWADATEWVYVGFNTIMAPNTPSCVMWGSDYQNQSMISASSYHSGGVNAVTVDGAVHFISESIDDVGDTSHAAWTTSVSGGSPFGVWGAMGSIDGGEVKTLW